ncbi:hypothetical protein NLJ89_g4379 [Agrocybe chaxingu]|uniref:Uncharacterized protein n=1 Tax=Agrocybe chaxingu TaxID=84603 RepID=A0A9W8K9T3_9AGAR|nr:hypothetical protein NLJ89_g4379 [Agrocybe chaxingu]
MVALFLPCPKCNISPLEIPPPPEVSPISSLLTTNDPPVSCQESIARDIIASSTAALAEVERILEEVNEILDALKTRQKEYKEHFRLHQNVIAKSRHLPNDILAEIFQQIVESHTNCGSCGAFDAKVMVDTTLLGQGPSPRAARAHNRLKKMLQRSGSLPLKLALGSFNYSTESKFIQIILPYVHRISTLVLDGPFAALKPAANVENTWTSLKPVELRYIDVSQFGGSITNLETAPVLQEVTISTWESCLADLQSVSVPRSRLRKVSVDQIEPPCALSLLQVSTSLEEYP